MLFFRLVCSFSGCAYSWTNQNARKPRLKVQIVATVTKKSFVAGLISSNVFQKTLINYMGASHNFEFMHFIHFIKSTNKNFKIVDCFNSEQVHFPSRSVLETGHARRRRRDWRKLWGNIAAIHSSPNIFLLDFLSKNGVFFGTRTGYDKIPLTF